MFWPDDLKTLSVVSKHADPLIREAINRGLVLYEHHRSRVG